MTTIEIYLNDIWSKTINHIKDSNIQGLDNLIINTYYAPSKLASIDNEKAIIVVGNEITKQIIIDKIPLICSSLEKTIEKKVTCSVITENEYIQQKSKIYSYQNNDEKEKSNKFQLKLKPEFTFENFVVGTSNKECQSASLACAYNPGKFYTPLFIYGNSGLGKTHLLHAIGNFVKSNYPEKNIYYTSGSDFVESVVNSIQNHSIDEFKIRLYDIDVLLMDDVQFIAGKEKSHEIFFSIFNELVNNRKQICITSDKHPTEIKGLEERLISRFSSGLSVGVDSPEFETAVAILRLKIKNQVNDSILIDDDVIFYLATHFSKDVRSLEGCINRLLFMSINGLNTDHIDLKSTIEIFKGQIDVTQSEKLSINKIKKEVSDYYGLTKQQLVSKTRTSNISNARHIAMYLCRKLMDIPFVKIGEEFGKRDHSTVMSACEKVENKIKKDHFFHQAIMEIENRVKMK